MDESLTKYLNLDFDLNAPNKPKEKAKTSDDLSIDHKKVSSQHAHAGHIHSLGDVHTRAHTGHEQGISNGAHVNGVATTSTDDSVLVTEERIGKEIRRMTRSGRFLFTDVEEVVTPGSSISGASVAAAVAANGVAAVVGENYLGDARIEGKGGQEGETAAASTTVEQLVRTNPLHLLSALQCQLSEILTQYETLKKDNDTLRKQTGFADARDENKRLQEENASLSAEKLGLWKQNIQYRQLILDNNIKLPPPPT